MRAAGPFAAPKAEPFPWEAVIAFGLGTLRLSPDAFWRLTPVELGAVLAARRGPAPPTGADLAALIAAHPD